MEVKVRLFGHLREYRPGDEQEAAVKMEPESSLADLVAELGIPEEELRFSLMLVNGRQSGSDRILQQGDTVSFVTMTEGG